MWVGGGREGGGGGGLPSTVSRVTGAIFVVVEGRSGAVRGEGVGSGSWMVGWGSWVVDGWKWLSAMLMIPAVECLW